MPSQWDYSWLHPALGRSELLATMDFSIGDKVSLRMPLTYLKTSDPMPMLRPPDLVSSDEIGEIVGLNTSETATVRFRRGSFLIPISHLTTSLSEDGESTP